MNLLSSPFAPRMYAFSVGLLSRGTSAFARESMGETPHLYPHLLILLPLNLSLPFGLVPTEATIGSYRQKHSARALRRVYSVEATFGSEKRCFHRYETGGEPWSVSAASSHQLSPHWHKASGSETQEKMLHSVAEAGRGGENARRASKSIGISSLACSEMWVKMRRARPCHFLIPRLTIH